MMIEGYPSLKVTDWYLMTDRPVWASYRSWLEERYSLTARFACYCEQVGVTPLREQFVALSDLGEEQAQLPRCERYWVREVILYGDGVPWLFGRTVIPESSLCGEEKALLTLGSTPLGRYLFRATQLQRDGIQIGQQGDLWARRCRLWLSGKPLLLSELFLPDSPMYGDKKVALE